MLGPGYVYCKIVFDLFQTFGMGSDGDHSYLWKGCTIVGGIYFFFITENLMKIYIRFSEWKVYFFPFDNLNFFQLFDRYLIGKPCRVLRPQIRG